MNKCFFFLLGLAAMLAWGCANTSSSTASSNGYSIKGTIANLPPGSQIFLDEIENSQKFEVMDTAVVAEDGSFEMTGELNKKIISSLRLGQRGNNRVLLVLEKGSDVEVDADFKSLRKYDYTIKGSPESTQILGLYNKLSKREIGEPYLVNFVDTCQSEQVAYLALSNLPIEKHYKVYENYENKLKKSSPNSTLLKGIQDYIAANKGALNATVGKVAPAIDLPDTDGKSLPLANLKGKIVLVDFWASWCRPCRKENPNVVRLYDQYKNKGFEVYSVSLDKTKEKWLAAIEQDNLKWDAHVSELQGWKSSAAGAYGVKSIPQTFLLDGEGKIIAKNLRGGALEAKLKEVLGG